MKASAARAVGRKRARTYALGSSRAPERVHAELVAARDGHAGNDERLGGVALGQDERARLAAAPARVVCVVQLGQACQCPARRSLGSQINSSCCPNPPTPCAQSFKGHLPAGQLTRQLLHLACEPHLA